MSIWTIRAALEWTMGYLERNNEENPRLAAQWLLSAATNLTRIELYTNYDQPLTGNQRTILREGIKRRVAGEPLQYILGKAPFRRLEFKVRPPILIPRPETEVLVDIVLEALDDDSRANILDLCTGTGCIALSLLYEHPGVRVTATDIDSEAVTLAQENAYELKLNERGHLLILKDDLAGSLVADTNNHASFDIVVSNPPYIPTMEYLNLSNEIVNNESRIALDGGEDGLDIFRRILDQAKILLAPGGLLACELHETGLTQAQALCEQQGFVDVTIHKDLTNKPRIITARAFVL